MTPTDDQIRALAAGCTSYAHLWKKLCAKWPFIGIDFVRAADARLELGLAPKRVPGPRSEGVAVPKLGPKAKGAK